MISNIGEGATPLMYACQQSREKEVLDLIARKRNSVRERDRTLKTPLHYCTENATTGCAEAILREAPELLDARDEDGYTALHLAVIAGNRTFLRFLVSRGANVNALDNERHSAVHWATVCGEEEALDIVLRAGANISTADIHGGYPLHYAAQMCGPGGEMGRNPKIGLRILNILLSHDIDIDVKDKDGRQPILWAASAGSADAILALVKAGASVEASDKDGLTALHCAASRGHTDCIETLVTLCGANIDVIDSNGCTALFYAVTLGHADASQLLLGLGAEPNRQDRKGRTPAHCGAAKGQLETLRILQSCGANLWLRNVKGDFPLHEAIASGRRDLVRWLLNQRPDAINVGNNDGRCPIHIAAINNNIDMIKILLDAQSLVNPIMRTTKGVLMTPLDASLHRGFRGCAKYLQLHGGVPFTKLTEKSSTVKGISSRQLTSDMYVDNYGDRLGISSWGEPHTSSTFLPGFVPTQIRMGGDNAIQQIQTTEMPAITRIREDYEDFRSSDEEKIYRRRRRRKKWEHHRKGNISEEDSNIDEHRRRRHREEDRKKRGQHHDSSSDNDCYRKRAMKKKDSTSDSEDAHEIRNRRMYCSATEDSENERKRERKRKPRKEGPQRFRAKSDRMEREKSGENGRPNTAKEKEVRNITIAEVHADPEPVESEKVKIVTAPDIEVTESQDIEKEVEIQEEDQYVLQEEASNLKEQIEANEDPESLAEELTTDNVVEEIKEMVPVESAEVVAVIEDRENSVVEFEPQEEEEEEKEEEGEDRLENIAEDVKQKVEEIQVPQGNEEVEGVEIKVEDAEGVEVCETEVQKAEVAEEKEEEEAKDEEAVVEEQKITEQEVEPTEPTEEPDETEGVKEAPDMEDGDVNVEKRVPNAGNTVVGQIVEEEDGVEIDDETEDDDDDDDDDEEDVEKREPGENAFEVLDDVPNSEEFSRAVFIRKNGQRRGSDSAGKEYRSMDAEGSIGEESGGSTRNEDSSALMDSGIEPSPRRRLKEGSVRSRVSRLCNRGKEPEDIPTVSVTQTVQNTIRKYHMERKIFYQLLELKRLQIRAGRANEQVLVKRLVDEYRRGGIIPGLKNYSGQYTFRQFEKFLYDQLRALQSTAHILIPKLRPSDDIETLSTILRKTRVELVDDIPENPMFCTQGTHRCHHAAHAYTGIPCAAYITKFNHHEMPKTRTSGFLPQIDQTYSDRSSAQYRPVTLEVSHGKEKQVISLPTDRLDKNKRYYVTFTIKGGPPLEEESKTTEERMLRHRHAKSL